MDISNLPEEYIRKLPAKDIDFVTAILISGFDINIFYLCSETFDNLDIFRTLLRHNYKFDISSLLAWLEYFCKIRPAIAFIDILSEILVARIISPVDHNKLLLNVVKADPEVMNFVLDNFDVKINFDIIKECMLKNVHIDIFNKLYDLSGLEFSSIIFELAGYITGPQMAAEYKINLNSIADIEKLIEIGDKRLRLASWITEYLRDYLKFDFATLPNASIQIIKDYCGHGLNGGPKILESIGLADSEFNQA
jgi:hypothetical protein